MRRLKTAFDPQNLLSSGKMLPQWTKLEDYPFRSTDKLRFGDTDRQGHVNNAAFATFFETGRVELLDQLGILAGRPGLGFVIANIGIDYRREVFWPGTVECGTAVAKIGVSSISLRQSLFPEQRLPRRRRRASWSRSTPRPTARRRWIRRSRWPWRGC